MLEIKNKMIKITKGDSAKLSVALTMGDGQTYEMKTGDMLTFTVRKRPDSDVLFQVTSNTNELTFTPNDTKKLEVGNCCFDIQLTTASSDVFTVVGLTDNASYNMVVYPEITV